MHKLLEDNNSESIAVVGMSCRLPGARNIAEYWKNIASGVESIRDLDTEEFHPDWLDRSNYVKRNSPLDDVDKIDADFFEMTAREATRTAPSHRMLLMCSQEALDDACYVAKMYHGDIGVYVGANKCDEWQRRLYLDSSAVDEGFAEQLQLYIAGDSDYSATRLSYKLNLTGPSISISCACSTALVAISQACKALLAYDCDMALAGGSCVVVPSCNGYLYENGGMLSLDGHCRAFDSRASGTVFGNGAGVVLLKRLEDALEDRDSIYAVVKGTAVSNDGADKVGYTAPSVSGQSRAISTALAFSGVDPKTIGYIEAHGMGTPLGDPIEVEALSKVYGANNPKTNYCALGTVKGNVGHLGIASGIAGFIKTVLALKHRQIPPTLHYQQPNPEIDFEHSPFFVNTELRPWNEKDIVRRAAVNCFGVGGTNAHVILEEAPAIETESSSRRAQLIVLSARSKTSLSQMAHALADRMQHDAKLSLADVCYSLKMGRCSFPYRRWWVSDRRDLAITALRSDGVNECFVDRQNQVTSPALIFFFPGRVSPAVNTAQLYRDEKVFRDSLDQCADIVSPLLQLDLRKVLYAQDGEQRGNDVFSQQSQTSLVLLFSVEYALSCLWQSWGIRPTRMIGQGVGEYVAACVSEVFDLKTGLTLAATYGGVLQTTASATAKNNTILPRVNLSAPRIAFLSQLTGHWISDSMAQDPAYWSKQTEHEIDIKLMFEILAQDELSLLLEVAPGQTLFNHLREFQHQSSVKVFSTCSLPDQLVNKAVKEQVYMLGSLGQLWSAGVQPDWNRFYSHEQRLRVSLPSYPFDSKRYWLDGSAPTTNDNKNATSHTEALPVEQQDLPLKALIQTMVCQLFGSEDISDQTPFIEMGMSSIMAIELSTQLTRRLNVDNISVVMLLEEDTHIISLSDILNEQMTAPESCDPASNLLATEYDHSSDQVSIIADAENACQPFSLTDIQQAYWVGRQGVFEGGNVATYVYLEKDLRDLHLPRFEQALNQMIQRHSMLRMVVDDDGMQRLLEEVPYYAIAFEDLTSIEQTPGEQEKRQQALDEVRRAMSHQVLVPEVWPLFEMRICQHESNVYRLHCGFDSLIMDGSSLQVFFRDLFLIYIGEHKRLLPLGINFRDYVKASRSNQETRAFQKAQTYWLNRINTLPAAPVLPQAKSSWQITQPRFQRRQFRLDAPTWNALKKNARQYGVTDSVVIATAYSEVLAKWSQCAHFTLNLTVFDRPPLHAQINDLIGDFTSSTLLEVDMSTGESFAHRSKNVQHQLLNDLEHRSFGGVKMLRAMNSRIGANQAVIMPVVLTSAVGVAQYDETLVADLEPQINQRYLEMMETDYMISQSSQVWLDNMVWENQGGILVNWDALEELFPSGVLDDMFTAYHQRLLQLAGVEDESVSNAWKMPAAIALTAVQQSQHDRINQTAQPESNFLLHELFDLQAQQTPSARAIVAGPVELSYGQLHALAINLAHHLQDAGVEPNQLVAVVMNKGWEQVLAVLGILYAGGAYMPIDASLPETRIQCLLALGEVNIALTQKSIAHTSDWSQSVQLIIADELDDSDAVAIPTVQTQTDLAYVIFTSGSTGTPKGVMIDHRGAVNTLHAINQLLSVGQDDAILGVSSLSFDLSVYDIFGILGAGATLVLPEFEKQFDPLHWRELIDQYGITLWNSAPQLMSMLVENMKEDILPVDDIGTTRLRSVLLSGDWIPLDLPQTITLYYPTARVLSLGGATEASVWSIYYPIESVDPDWHSIPYGRPLANQTIQVLDSELRPCPNYVNGNIYIGGIGLALGYWANSEETAQRFVYHPDKGERLYHTGDIGHWSVDGQVILLGRVDHQVKIQGHRIELGEIEFVLRQCEGVDEAVVLANSAKQNQKHLMAYVVPTSKQRSDIDVIDGHSNNLEVFRGFDPQEIRRQALDKLLRSVCDHVPINGNVDAPLMYIYIKGQRVQGLSSGLYLYDAMIGILIKVIDADSSFSEKYFLANEQVLHRQSAFSILFVGREVDVSAESLISKLLTEATDLSITLYPMLGFNHKLLNKSLDLQNDVDILGCLEGGGLSSTSRSEQSIELQQHDLSETWLDTLRSELPGYMVPSGIVLLPSLPLTTNGKVDNKALSKLNPISKDVKSQVLAPRNDIERGVFELWKVELASNSFCINDNLFELGGNSITATKLVSKARKELGVNLALHEFIARPTVAGMAATIFKARDVEYSPSIEDSDFEGQALESERQLME
jgi:amino acid adenylation domain-containing protein